MEELKISFITSEITPYSKTGGLADVSHALPKELKKLGCDVIVITPKYKTIDETKFNLQTSFELSFGPDEHAIIKQTETEDGVKIYFIANNIYFGRDQLYGEKNGDYVDYPDNAKRFAFFSKACLELLKKLNYKPDIIHTNDWQTALVPIYLKTKNAYIEFFKNTKTIHTIHNIGYQGIFEKEKMHEIDVDWSLFNIEVLEFWNRINLLKGAIALSDAITTVSEKYSYEIQTPEFGFGLDGILKKRANSLFGVINGVDYSIWDPKVDKYLQSLRLNYTSTNLSNKKKLKLLLLKEFELPLNKSVPLIGMISRLVSHKGFDILAEAFDELMKLDIIIVILGAGEKKYEDFLLSAKSRYPTKVGVYLGFSEELAHKIEAGADMFLMPSAYEPGGLSQLYSLRYGTIPIVRETGGLADTILQFKLLPDNEIRGNGFVFQEYSATALLNAVKEAVELYCGNPQIWTKLMKAAMEQDWSWSTSAMKYLDLYKKILTK